jgi:hypothetical protein
MQSALHSMGPKRQAILKTLLFAGWNMNVSLSSEVDDLFVLEKFPLRISLFANNAVRLHRLPGGQGDGDTKLLAKANLHRVFYAHRKHYVIHVKFNTYQQYTINVRHPETYKKETTFDLDQHLRRAHTYLLHYVATQGTTPKMSAFRFWMQKEFKLSDQPGDFIYRAGVGRFWTGRKWERGTNVIPFKREKKAPVRPDQTDEGGETTPNEETEA